MTDMNIIRTLRCMAWQRAKGELQSMLQTFWSQDDSRDGQYDGLKDAIKEFVRDVQERGLQE
jgi:hypothetical protein